MQITQLELTVLVFILGYSLIFLLLPIVVHEVVTAKGYRKSKYKWLTKRRKRAHKWLKKHGIKVLIGFYSFWYFLSGAFFTQLNLILSQDTQLYFSGNFTVMRIFEWALFGQNYYVPVIGAIAFYWMYEKKKAA